MRGLAMRLTDRLRMEHEAFRRVLDDMEGSLALPRPQALHEIAMSLRFLVPAMARHESLEETILFPAYRRAGACCGRGIAAFAETHKEIWRVLGLLKEELRETRRPAWAAEGAMERLIFTLREHLTEEETVLYSAIEAALGDEALSKLGDRAETRSPVAVGQPED